MTTLAAIDKTRYRLARFYLDKLRTANEAYQRGHENALYGLRVFDQEWDQIKLWHGWAKARADLDMAAADLCTAYTQIGADLLQLRLSTTERLAWLKTGLKLARQAGDPPAELANLLGLVYTYRMLDEYTQSAETADQALELARQLGDRRSMAHTLNEWGLTARLQGSSDAHVYHEQSLALYRALGDRPGIGSNFLNLGFLALDRSDLDVARDYFEQAYAIFRELGNLRRIATSLHFLGIVSTEAQEYDTARSYLEQGLALCRAIGDRRGIAMLVGSLSGPVYQQGDKATARAYLEENIAIMRDLHDWYGVVAPLCGLGYMSLFDGDYTTAQSALEESLALSRQIGYQPFIVESLNALALVYPHLDQRDRALQCLHDGISIAQGLPSDRLLLTLLATAVLICSEVAQPPQRVAWIARITRHPHASLKPEIRVELQRVCATLQASLDAEVFAIAWQHGATLDLATIIEQIL